MLARILFYLLVLIVVIAPLPFGSNSDWAWSPLACVVGFMVILLPVAKLDSDASALSSLRALSIPALFVAIVVLWGVIQAAGITPSSWQNPIRESSGALLSPRTPHTIALESEQVWVGILRLLLYVGAFILAAEMGFWRSWVRVFTNFCWMSA